MAMRIWRQFYLDHDGVLPSAVGFDTESASPMAALRTKIGRRRAIKQLASQAYGEDGQFTRFCSLLQLATHECCLLIQLERIKSIVAPDCKSPAGMPYYADLIHVLEDSHIVKAGVSATADGETVKRTLGVSMASIVDVDRLAAVRGHAAASLSELARIYAHEREMPHPEYKHYTDMDRYLEERLAAARSRVSELESMNIELDDLPQAPGADMDSLLLAEETHTKSIATEAGTTRGETAEEVTAEGDQEDPPATASSDGAGSGPPYPSIYGEPPDGLHAIWDWNSVLTPPMIRYAAWDALAGLRILEGMLWNKTRRDYQPLFVREVTPFPEVVTSVCHTMYQSIQSTAAGLVGTAGDTPAKGCTGWRLISTAMTSYGWWVRAYPIERRRAWAEQILRMLLATGTLVPVRLHASEMKKVVKTVTVVTTQAGEHVTTTTEETQSVWTNVPAAESAVEISQKPISWILRTRFQLALEMQNRAETSVKTKTKHSEPSAESTMASATASSVASKEKEKAEGRLHIGWRAHHWRHTDQAGADNANIADKPAVVDEAKPALAEVASSQLPAMADSKDKRSSAAMEQPSAKIAVAKGKRASKPAPQQDASADDAAIEHQATPAALPDTAKNEQANDATKETAASMTNSPTINRLRSLFSKMRTIL
ncbi:hypothetical protein SYNPS1DRAFT_28987 [Syncephalis pseudoplumigaleata]|uniref:Uncharacterized protein n=1 Tax=Syncephalis pseudoplumigaleata TaxID=1712513 RepID=A0A4P9YYY1_9FUNG|nr:hypothetical protein SYNPS1DRAFT_28987 [Syncephalis pseudoplumigaleata]|eukprot:RKP25274.1 hypothetical protein SYNPS1DRAFT_28987 [Syncephalis pseudoplumigaleata]